MSSKRKWILFSVVGFATLAADQATKFWARSALPWDEQRGYGLPVTVVENFWDWRLSYNTGVAFGMFHGLRGAPIFLTIIGLCALAAIFWMARQARPEQVRLTWALGLVGGGALGNILDRLLFGKVTDFVVWKYHQHEWPTFNVADAALCVGVALLFIELGREARAEKARAQAEGGAGPARKTGRKK